MCLAIPGRILEISAEDLGLRMGRVGFGGIIKQVCLAYVPDAVPGDYVIVHAGFAISRLDTEEAGHVFEELDRLGAVSSSEPSGEDHR